MFKFFIEKDLQKKLRKLSKRDKSLHQNFSKKIEEIIMRDEITIHFYKNLKTPMNEYKRIHLTNKHILLFRVNFEKNLIIFVDIKHRDESYET